MIAPPPVEVTTTASAVRRSEWLAHERAEAHDTEGTWFWLRLTEIRRGILLGLRGSEP